MGAIEEIAAERQRQVEVEGWTAQHDDEHCYGELAKAAAAYAAPESLGIRSGVGVPLPARWPWAASWWKPKSRRRDLIRAAALIVAEIERLDRLSCEG